MFHIPGEVCRYQNTILNQYPALKAKPNLSSSSTATGWDWAQHFCFSSASGLWPLHNSRPARYHWQNTEETNHWRIQAPSFQAAWRAPAKAAPTTNHSAIVVVFSGSAELDNNTQHFVLSKRSFLQAPFVKGLNVQAMTEEFQAFGRLTMDWRKAAFMYIVGQCQTTKDTAKSPLSSQKNFSLTVAPPPGYGQLRQYATDSPRPKHVVCFESF